MHVDRGKQEGIVFSIEHGHVLVQSALLRCRLIVSELLETFFVLNLYGLCTANSVIDSSQCAIAWHADDNKIYHDNPSDETDAIKILEEHFGKMVITRGCQCDLLGLNLSFGKDVALEVGMKECLEKSLRISEKF